MENKAIIDVAKSSLIINNNSNNKIINELDKNKICFTLNPRTETVVAVPIAETEMENKNVTIYKQKLIKNV